MLYILYPVVEKADEILRITFLASHKTVSYTHLRAHETSQDPEPRVLHGTQNPHTKRTRSTAQDTINT
ncbi:hypothetical protein, partial [Francisella tularensis]|uniref:hypothetical protein n=1 Tax=Francisella tularensis TaxID=263 RepID=UPI001C0EDFD7